MQVSHHQVQWLTSAGVVKHAATGLWSSGNNHTSVWQMAGEGHLPDCILPTAHFNGGRTVVCDSFFKRLG